ncbi:unnamed protein product [Mytilus coruscus]|uniref:ZAD domain-containing protein n=1 Tax=Mytilus coruscus TaxID=42192 RepID=A0A6J8C5S2_MYTCO|nr:unnamed protein product [Mytilus coruscus]
MDQCNRICFHCTHVFDLNNLKNEKRRNLKKEIKEVNAVKILSECYEIDEEQIRNVVDIRVDDVFICNQCVITLKAVFTCKTKLKNLLNNVKKSASPQFIEFANNLQTVVDQDEDEDEDEYPAVNTITEKCPTTTKKRALHALTPSKSGCTPRGKRNRFSTPSKGARRRQLKFQTPKPPQTPKSSQTPSSCRKITETSKLQSPGPKVKVTRDTKLYFCMSYI